MLRRDRVDVLQEERFDDYIQIQNLREMRNRSIRVVQVC